jgi:hypothetical protein
MAFSNMYSLKTIRSNRKRAEMLLDRVKQNDTLHEAIKASIEGNLQVLRRELCLGYPINERCLVTGRTVLHEAAASGHLHVVKLLCYDHRATLEVDRTTMMGSCTALHLAVQNNYRPIAALLLTMGADINLQDRSGNTPLHLVSSLAMCKLLLKTTANVLLRNRCGRTALEEYLERTAPIDQIHALVDILKQVEGIQSLSLVHEKMNADEDRRQRELDRLAFVNQDESMPSRFGRANPANFRVAVQPVVNKKEAIEREQAKEKEREKRKLLEKARQREREKEMPPLQATIALLNRLTRANAPLKAREKEEKEKLRRKAEGEDEVMSDEYSDEEAKFNHVGMQVVTKRDLQRRLLEPPMREVVINQQFHGSRRLK